MVDNEAVAKSIAVSPPSDQRLSVGAPSGFSPPVTDSVGDVEMVKTEVKGDGIDGGESRKEGASGEAVILDGFEVKNGGGETIRSEFEVKSDGIDRGESRKEVTSVETVITCEFVTKNDGVDGGEGRKEVTGAEKAVRSEFEVRNDGGDSNGEEAAVSSVEEAKMGEFSPVNEGLGLRNGGVDGNVSGNEVVSVEPVKTEELSPVNEELKVAIEEGEGKNEAVEVKEDKEKVETEETKESEGKKVEQEEEEVKDMEEDGEVEEMEDDKNEETPKSGGGNGGKRKRGRNAKATPVKTPGRKIVGEDVCYICLDGGDLVLCDRRGCPKAYHPVCVDHDEEFFKTKGRWNCGWHLCNNCGKNAYFMCLTCTFSLCKGCCKDSVVFCVKGNKGFCESCMKTIMMIENGGQNDMGLAAFDDKSSWEYLFKDYWLEQKRKWSITSDELSNAKNPWNSSDTTNKHQNIEACDDNDDEEIESGSSPDANSKRKRAKKKSKSENSDTDSLSEKDAKRKSRGKPKSQIKRLLKSHSNRSVEWASKELLDFVMHMKDGDTSVLSQFDVQALLLEYIKRNKLRDPRRRSQIICDPMLQKMFGKPRVGHFEMLKLLESHFLVKEDFQADDNHGSVVDDVDDDNDSMDVGRSKGKKSRKRGEERGLQSNLDDYAAIDTHNINLIYLRRSLIEALIENTETFHDKVVGSYVRIRIPGSQKQDIYRLVQIIGTTKAGEPYKVGKRTTDFRLEILNLDKTENISIDIISNQEFTEDECKRLRQSIKCGLLSRMTVGDILEKARELQEVRVNDWLEAEIVKLCHLRDRASEKGRKKELRLCVEKLQLLKSPEERQRRIEQIPEVHADPKMDPNCEESEDESQMNKNSKFNMSRGRDHFANPRPPNKNWESNRSLSSKGYSSRREETDVTPQAKEHARNNGVGPGTPRPRSTSDPLATKDRSPVTPSGPSQAVAAQPDAKINESEKIWHYRDPSGKVQGPFSMIQLRKWSNTGYFPAELRIWKTQQGEDDSILLTDVLAGKSQKVTSDVSSQSETTVKNRNTTPSSLDTSRNAHGSDSVNWYGSNLPSPTPSPSTASKWSSPSSSRRSDNQFRGGNERLPSPTPPSPSSATSRLGRSSFSKQVKDSSAVGNKVENVGASPGVVGPTSGSRPDMSLNSGSLNTQQISPQSTPPASIGQNLSVYGHGLQSGYVARPESVNANTALNHPNPMAPQLPQGQWTGVGYPPSMGNMTMPSHNAWSPQPNVSWTNQQPPPVNPNTGWSMPPPSAFGPSGPNQVPVPLPNMGWPGSGPSPQSGTLNHRATPPGNTGGAQRKNRQRGICKFYENGRCRKGSACDFLHT